jgi:hypothetical protein
MSTEPAPEVKSSPTKSSHVINTSISYSELSNVRKFLRQFARPSTLSDLIDSTEGDPVWHDLVIRVYVEVTGEPPSPLRP